MNIVIKIELLKQIYTNQKKKKYLKILSKKC